MPLPDSRPWVRPLSRFITAETSEHAGYGVPFTSYSLPTMTESLDLSLYTLFAATPEQVLESRKRTHVQVRLTESCNHLSDDN